jgi:hypothetical protein
MVFFLRRAPCGQTPKTGSGVMTPLKTGGLPFRFSR